MRSQLGQYWSCINSAPFPYITKSLADMTYINMWDKTKWLNFCWWKCQQQFFLINIVVFSIKLHWSVFPRSDWQWKHHGFGQWLGAQQVQSHFLNKWWHSAVTQLCIIKTQGVHRRQTYVMAFRTMKTVWCTHQWSQTQVTNEKIVSTNSYIMDIKYKG